MPQFDAQVELPCSPAAAFEFLIQPANIRAISPPDLQLVFDTAPVRLSLGARLAFRVQAFGVIRSAVHEIIAWNEPQQFVERQVEGPMGDWIHAHEFEPKAGGVLVRDRIEFSPPGGLLGLLVNERKIHESLEDGFAHRHQALERHFRAANGGGG